MQENAAPPRVGRDLLVAHERAVLERVKSVTSTCVTSIVDAFVQYLHTPDAQDVFQSVGYQRPIDVKEAAKGSDGYPPVQDLFTTDDLGGWDQLVSNTVFGPDGAFTQAFKAAKG